jgi:NhaA family Na+:H+ antiporter
MNSTQDPNVTPPPPEAWLPARRLAQSVAQPLERFMHIQASSGLVLLATAIVALVWANSPWHQSYEALWHTRFTIGLGEWVFERDLHFWINDFLMAVFFLVVGLEIKRELAEGALSEWKRAALPMAAALGGMVVPALLYFSLNTSGPSQSGWGVPMATDIAFAVGILTLLGKRVPATLRVLLLAIAIVDDIGAIIVIAVFYSAGIDLSALAWVGGGILGLFVLHAIGIRPGFIYAIPGIVLWAGMLKLGVHPTIAGVIIGFMTPVKPWFGKEGFLTEARTALDDFQARVSRHDHDDELLKPLGKLARARREALSPAKRIEANLHPYVAFGIMPLFALANAGVNVGGVELGETTSMAVFLGVTLGLVVGKPLGIVGVSWLSTRLGLCSLPDGVRWSGLFVVGAAGGIGFTMAIFIGELAFTEALLPVAKIGVLFGTLAASLLALAGGLVFLRPEREVDAAMVTLSDAEGCTDYWTTDEQPVQDKM